MRLRLPSAGFILAIVLLYNHTRVGTPFDSSLHVRGFVVILSGEIATCGLALIALFEAGGKMFGLHTS